MKILWKNLYILWGVSSLGLLGCAPHTDESPFTVSKHPKSKPVRLSTRGDPDPGRSSPSGQISTPPLGRRWPASPRSARPGEPAAETPPGSAPRPDVSVTCSAADFVVRVKPAFYGLGADADELKLGGSCKSNGVLRPYGDLLFTYPLTACGAVRELRRGHLVYKFALHYEPSRRRFPSRAQPVHVDVECRYQRTHHVRQLSVKPTWQTAVLRQRLKSDPGVFHLYLMDDSWNEPAKSQEYQLGKTLNFQVSASHLPPAGKLYVDSCSAAPSSGATSSLQYTIIDNFGCMLDSRSDPGASWFVSRTDKTVRFSLKAFQFSADPDTEISIHCKVSVTSEDAGPTHKSCTYRGDRWRALTADDSVCECCDSQCVTSKPRRAVIEGSASSRSLLVSDQLQRAEDDGIEEETIINHYTDERHSWESPWGGSDVIIMYDDVEEGGVADDELEDEEEESRTTVGGTTESRSDKLDFRDAVEEWKTSEVSANEFEEDESVHYDGLLESEEQEKRSEEKVDEISDKEQVIHLNENSEVLRDWAQLEQLEATTQQQLPPPHSKHEDKKSNYAVRSEENGKTAASEVEWTNEDDDLADNDEVTWYFTWK